MLEEEVVRRFLAGETLQKIQIVTGAEQRVVLDILAINGATSRLVKEESEKFLDGKYAPFFNKISKGRPKLEEKRRRKIRQIRISDEELAKMGNPKSSQIRDDLLWISKLAEFLDCLDEHGVKLLPESVLHATHNPNDPFWSDFLYGNNLAVLKAITRSP